MPRPRLRSPERSVPLRLPLALYGLCASLRLAVVLIGAYAVVLACATFIEADYGSEVARFAVYGTWWFVGLNALLGLNVLCAALIRFPWKKHQIGFLVTHAGILVLLVGCAVTWWAGIDARLSIVEGMSSHRAFKDTQHFEVKITPGGADGRGASESQAEPIKVPFFPGPFNWDDYRRQPWWFPARLARRSRGVLYDRDGMRLEVLDYHSDSERLAVPRITLVANPRSDSLRNRSVWAASPERMTLTVHGRPDPHGASSPFGSGDRKATPQGHRVNFWMTGGPEETEAFLASRPEGPLGRLGQVVLSAGGKTFHFPVDQLRGQPPQPLGTTGLKMELVEFDPRFPGVHLRIHAKNGPPETMTLYASLPHFNRQDHRNGVFGTYWFDATRDNNVKKSDGPPQKVTPRVPEQMLRDMRWPRVDVIQGHDRKLYYRAWQSPMLDTIAPWPANPGKGNRAVGTQIAAFGDSEVPLVLRLEEFIPRDKPGWEIRPVPFDKDKPIKQRRARLRLTADGPTEEFWLAGPPGWPPRGDEEKIVRAKNRRVRITMPQDEIDVGFHVYLHKFNRKLDPGSGNVSHYSSLVDFLDHHDQKKQLQKEVLITLNAPVNFSNPRGGRSYRLFQSSFRRVGRPGDQQFDELALGEADENTLGRDELFVSELSVNYDPGRGLKYAGSLLIVVGIGIMFYMKAYFFSPRGEQGGGTLRRASLLLAAFSLTAAGAARGSETAELDWSAWQHVPVFAHGRLMPLDTYARSAVRTICDRDSVKLELQGALPEEDVEKAEFAGARELFPRGGMRKFSAAELLFSWLVEADKWERVPMLVARDRQLREEILGVPIKNKQGHRLKFVSPWQVENATGLHRRLEKLGRRQSQARQDGKSLEPSRADRALQALVAAFNRYRFLTFDPTTQGNTSGRFLARRAAVTEGWGKLGSNLSKFGKLDPGEGMGRLLVPTGDALRNLRIAVHKEPFSLKETEPLCAALCRTTDALAGHFAKLNRQFADNPLEWEEKQFKSARVWIKTAAFLSADLARQSNEMHLGLYDNDGSPRILPALNPAALEKSRQPGDDAQPWLSLQAVLLGSDDLLAGYPRSELREVRKAFAEAKTAYLERDDPGRPERFNAAMGRFVATVGKLGEKIEPLRKRLPIRHRDKDLIALTAYPPPGSTRVEVHYNQFNPFLWSWVLSLGAAVCLVLALGLVRKPMFWAGLGVLLAGQLSIVYGFALRVHITNWAPVTNMFETVVFVALVVSMLGLWLTLLPLIWPGIKNAWRLAAAPLTWEETPLGEARTALWAQRKWSLVSWILLVPRAYLTWWILHALAMAPYGSTGRAIFSLKPGTDVGSSMPTASDLLVWLVGLSVLLPTVWFMPRVILTTLASVLTVPYTLLRQGTAEMLRQVYARKPCAVVGASVAFLAAAVAYFSPVFSEEIGPLQPVLRNNFWLLIHVLTITASYGAGALAWGLGNIALAYYLFGRYRDPAGSSAEVIAAGRRPPERCASLATFIYKSTQVAVLLLAAGTILGALWADVSWGRFWGWDAKEVWALISLLVYLVILHGRYAGWLGNFGLALGSVLGATAILMAWYGVNFVLGSGLHTYGGGAGGKEYVAALVLANWLFTAAAAVRYYVHTRIAY